MSVVIKETVFRRMGEGGRTRRGRQGVGCRVGSIEAGEERAMGCKGHDLLQGLGCLLVLLHLHLPPSMSAQQLPLFSRHHESHIAKSFT